MKSIYIFPIILIILDIGAAAVYLYNRQYKKCQFTGLALLYSIPQLYFNGINRRAGYTYINCDCLSSE